MTPPAAARAVPWRLLALEYDGLLLGLGRVAGGHVVGHELDRRAQRLEPHRLGEAAVGEGVDGALDALHGQRRVGGDLRGDGHGGGHQVLAGRHLLHDADALGLGGRRCADP